MRKDKYDYLGLSLLLSAFLLTVIFLITCIKKRNLLAAIAAVAAIDAAGGLYLIRRRKNKNGGCFFDFFDENNSELCDSSKIGKPHSAVNPDLRKRRDESLRFVKTAVVCEIPIDDETTEEDFL